MTTIIVGAIVVIIIAFAVYMTLRNRKRAKGCKGGCDGCVRGKD